MRAPVMRVPALSLILLCVGRSLAADVETDPWVTMTQRDLQAIHDILAANHPGPVDPQSDVYRRWLEDGLQVARAEAAKARTFADYTRALRRYLNGFRDGHIQPRFLVTADGFYWPGFLVARAPDGAIRILTAAEEENSLLGAELVSCDGASTEQLMRERLDPYYWNADIPHERGKSLPRLFQSQPFDTTGRLATCVFRAGDTTQTVELKWRYIARDALTRHLQAMQPPAPALGLEKRQGIWFVSIPSFGYAGPSTAGITAMIDEMKAHAVEMRSGTVVFDVRGNGGGNSVWGERVAAALWGERAVKHVSDSFDWTVDWRVSRDNIEHLNSIVANNQRDSLTEAVEYWTKARDAVVEALKRQQSLVRVPEPPRTSLRSAPESLVTGRVFLLTDGACASACLDFVDIVRRLPKVTHVGLPTSADAVYIDNTEKTLPSGLARLSYSLKVYRNRVRANNEWYEPEIRWPGGAMTDDAITPWIAQLASAPASKDRRTQ